MTRIPVATVQKTSGPQELAGGVSFAAIQNGMLEVQNLSAGMVNRMPRDKVPAGSARDLQNARVRDYYVGRREGTASFGGTKPDSNQILGIVTFITEDDQTYICRITSAAFHVLDPDLSGWTAYAILDADGNSTTFIGQNRHVSIAQFFSSMYIADGINPIWRVDFTAQTVQEIAEAPKANYIATFADRIIAGNVDLQVGGHKPSSIIWPVNADPRDWTGLGSGREDLAATDIGSEINGLFAFGNQMVILRRRAIWHVGRQPFALAPFTFTPVISGIGCDLPHTAVKVPGGIIFADQRTREVYFYTPGSRPQPLAGNVNRDVVTDLANLTYAQGTFDPYEGEYHLGVVPEGETLITKTWVLNLQKGAWAYDPEPTISALGVVSLPGASVTIDSLTGDIDSQSPGSTGTIDEYGSQAEFKPTLFKGTSTGEVLKQSFDADNEWDGTAFELLFSSPNVGSVSRRRTLKDLSVGIEPGSGGAYTIEESKDESTWTNTKTGTIDADTKNLRLPKTQLSGMDLYWRVKTASPKARLLHWWIRVLEKGLYME